MSPVRAYERALILINVQLCYKPSISGRIEQISVLTRVALLHIFILAPWRAPVRNE